MKSRWSPRRPATAFRRSWPRKEGQDRAGRAEVIAEIKVVRARVIEVDGPLYEPKSEDLRVKVEVALRVGCDCCDVMKTYDSTSHDEVLLSSRWNR
jgi:hypothetical protein